MSAIHCACGAVVIDLPGTLPTGFLTPCPDCDPDGYERRWSCPWPHHAPEMDITYLRRRVEVLEGQLIQVRGALQHCLTNRHIVHIGHSMVRAELTMSHETADAYVRLAWPKYDAKLKGSVDA